MPISISPTTRNHIAAILIIILVVISSGESKQYEAGRSYTFIGPTPPEGQSYSYLWIATDGQPATSSNISFQWTAPLVAEPTKVMISLLTDSGAVGCTSYNETELLVFPSPEYICAFVADTPVCANSTGNYALVTNPITGTTYAWSISESPGASITADPADSSKATWSAGTGTRATISVNATMDGYSSNCSRTVMIQSGPTAEAGPDQTTCTGSTVQLAGSATNALSTAWTTSGDGSFDDAGKFDAIYTPGTDDEATGSVTLTLSATGESACNETATSDIVITIQRCARGFISGMKFEDKNGNNKWDTDDPGLGGWAINLNRRDGEVVKTAITSADQATLGYYSIGGISPGTYLLEEVPSFSSDWTQTYPVGNIYTIVVSETGQVTVTKSDQIYVPSTQVNFGNKFTLSGELEIMKTTSVDTLIPNMQTTFTITVENIGKIEIHDIKIVDELCPMLEFVPYAYSGDILIAHTIAGGKLNFDLSPLGSLQPGNSWTITYNARLIPEVCNAASSATASPPVIIAGETKLNVMAAGSDSANILQIIDALSRNKTKMEAKLESIKKEQLTFDKPGAALQSSIKCISGTNYTLKNYTNISTGETLKEQLNASGFLVFSEYIRPAKRDLLAITYDMNGKVLSDFYTFLPTNETLKVEYNKPEKGYKTYTIRYYATGETLIITVDSYGNVRSREYRRTPGLALPQYLTNCATAYGNAGEQNEPVESNRACVDVGWRCESAMGSVSGTKFEDKNGNNEWDTDEPGLGDWLINLMDQDGEVVKAAMTSSSLAALGSYSIDNIFPGTYTLAEMPSLVSDWTQTYPAGNIYIVVVSETGASTVTRSDGIEVATTQANFGNRFTQFGELEITKTTPDVTINQNTQSTFIITVKNIGTIEINNIKIVDELSPMLEFIFDEYPAACCGDGQETVLRKAAYFACIW